MNGTSDTLRQASLDLSDSLQMSRIARALSVPTRVEILRLLSRENIMSVNEIARTLSIPVSTASSHINILEDAGLLISERMSGIHGVNKMCSKKVQQILFTLQEDAGDVLKQLVQNMPIGAYSEVNGITSPCGLASHAGPIGAYNRPLCFYMPERLQAQVLWMKSGSLTYRFSSLTDKTAVPEALKISFETCTQGEIDTVLKTEIHVRVNGHDLGGIVLNGDMDGQRGTLNPDWWPDVITQHGELCEWRVTRQGSFLHDRYLSGVTLDDLDITGSDAVTVELYVPEDSEYRSGLNLFGNGFGNYDQALQLIISYRK